MFGVLLICDRDGTGQTKFSLAISASGELEIDMNDINWCISLWRVRWTNSYDNIIISLGIYLDGHVNVL